MPSSTPIDPQNNQIHKVKTVVMDLYKIGGTPTVAAVCGKVWAPTLPFQDNFRTTEQCPICFPTEDNRYTIAK